MASPIRPANTNFWIPIQKRKQNINSTKAEKSLSHSRKKLTVKTSKIITIKLSF